MVEEARDGSDIDYRSEAEFGSVSHIEYVLDDMRDHASSYIVYDSNELRVRAKILLIRIFIVLLLSIRALLIKIAVQWFEEWRAHAAREALERRRSGGR